jgi:hypothetical protein
MKRRFFCTLFDKNYKYHAELLYNSLKKQHNNFKVFFFCFDELALQHISSFDESSAIAISSTDLECAYPKLLEAKQNRNLIEYYFTCTAAICKYVFEHYDEVDEIVYLDADLYFFDSPEVIFNEIGTKSISIIPHRFNFLNYARNIYGRFNVGWVSFKRDSNGIECLNTWFSDCLNWCYDRLTLKSYADQKYLNYWPNNFEVCIIKNIGANAAPWNIGNYKVSKFNNRLYINNKPLVFYHFASIKKIGDSYYTTCSSYFHMLNKIVREEIYKVYLGKLCELGYKPFVSSRLKSNIVHNSIRSLLRFTYKDYIDLNNHQ